MKSVEEILSNFPQNGSRLPTGVVEKADLQKLKLVAEIIPESQKPVLCLPPLTALDPDTVTTRKRRRE